MFLAEVAQQAAEIAQAGITITPKAIATACVGVASALGVGMIGAKGVESIGRNPGSFTSVLIFGLVAMALAEGLAILVYLGIAVK